LTAIFIYVDIFIKSRYEKPAFYSAKPVAQIG